MLNASLIHKLLPTSGIPQKTLKLSPRKLFSLRERDGIIVAKPILWVILLLQCPQLLQSPWLIPVHLLSWLIAKGIVHICRQGAAGLIPVVE